jgi:glycosyltransferase involved in cell wall biosynthesis
VRVAVTMYDLIPLLDPDGFSTWHPYHRAIYHWYLRTARGADLLVVISRTTAHWAVEHLGVDPAHIAVVPPLVEHPVSLARVPEPEPTFVWVGALDRHKRPELAVLALAAFRLRHGGGLLRFIGPADPARMRVIQETARRAGVGDAVILEGHLPAVELEAAFSSAAALLTTSRMEGFGLPAVEAAMRGVPVVAVDIPAAREALGDTATFTQADPSRIADALEAVRPASPASRKRLVERYARPAVADALSSAYLRLLGPTA